MIAFLLLLQAATTPAGPPSPVNPTARRFDACAALVKTDAAAAVAEGERWSRESGGGLPARLCVGLAYVAQSRWAPAEIAFAQAAAQAEEQRDGRAAGLWVQAANAALAGDDAAKARADLDRAIALPVLSDVMRGEAYLDRARAGVALGDLATARGDLDQAVKLVPNDPLGWLLSAALARRQGDHARAVRDLASARTLDSGAPEISEEAARIAAMPTPPASGR
ncbi:MAG TPA: tetratricopeptide repeat protein [Sphingomonas sp.]|jgi:tetratricopeptide (TPR) repeat protein|uniref:tetratricopeptide repeat protein n=1 Tax=Sphingomonas sp. TaxID=28214 RepID=UPI002ED818D8